MIINFNGQIVPRSDARISIFDHGFLYGASVYESIRTYGGKPFLLDHHLSRLEESAAAIHIRLPFPIRELKADVLRTLAEAPGPESTIRIILTRGEGELGYAPENCGAPNRIILIAPLSAPPAEIYEKGVALAIVEVRRNLQAALNPAVKSGNLLNQLLAWNEAQACNAYESLMLNSRGELTECAMCNLFLVKDQGLQTPALECGILAGLTRQLVLDVARESKIKAEETVLYPSDLFQADEVFLTVTSRELIPVVRCDGRTIGSGLPGIITRFLHLKYREKLKTLILWDSEGS
jgi:branched-chain amino acid aminotransferase